MITVLSFGNGQDSVALLYKYQFDPDFRKVYAPNRFVVVISETGKEHPGSYENLARTKVFCEENGIEFWHLTPDLGFHLPSWISLDHQYDLNHTVGSKSFPKTCTDNLKIRPIYKWLAWWIEKEYGFPALKKRGLIEFAQTYGKIKMLIGFAHNESRGSNPATWPKWKQASVDQLYPLQDMRMDRKACQDYIRSLGFIVPPPSNCMTCPFLDEVELVYLYRFHPEVYFNWVRQEQAKIDRNQDKPNNFGVWGKRLLPQVLEEALVKYGEWSDERLIEWKMSHGHCVMSRY